MTADGTQTQEAEDESADATPTVDAARLAERLGRYQLVLPLAQGGMGLVFAARLVGNHGVERLVAIKTLRPITSKSDRAALLREAKLTARLHHRNVVATIDLGEVDDVPYVVMELIDGVPLSRLLSAIEKRRDLIAPELAGWIVMQAALGLHAAHELADADGKPLHLVHRDVSPQNILISVDGEVKIADFGIAKFAGREESTATGVVKGKFAYMSPEQAGSAELDRRSDVFALGVVLWEALTGARAFHSETPARTIMRVLEHTPKKPLDVRPEVGEELSAITMRCMAKDADARFASAAAVAEALRGALRTRGAPVDEGDLASLVKTHFGDERTKFMDRLRTEYLDTDGTTRTLTPQPEPSAVMSVSSGARAAPATRPRSRLSLAIAAGALGIGLVGWQLAKPSADKGEKKPATAASDSVAEAVTSTATATPSASVAPVESPAPSAIASAPPSASIATIASPPRPAPRKPPPPPKPSAAPAEPAAPAASVAPPPKPPAPGQPFDSL
ncbi:MAG: protein kinase [Labilithrix sp.]|nr:protein kinase [Labilithrix sp.]